MAYDVHTAWANTLALKLADIFHGRPTGPNSEIVLDANGQATGETVMTDWEKLSDAAPGKPGTCRRVRDYVLTPGIHAAIDRTEPGANNELQITDALQILLDKEPVYACAFEGTRYDTGNHLGFLKTQVALALRRPDMREQVRSFLQELLAEQD